VRRLGAATACGVFGRVEYSGVLWCMAAEATCTRSQTVTATTRPQTRLALPCLAALLYHTLSVHAAVHTPALRRHTSTTAMSIGLQALLYIATPCRLF